jgi:hypothetical protein
MTGIYRIPLKKVYARKHSAADASWIEVYGKARCLKCGKPLNEGDPYRVITIWKKSKNGSSHPIHKYQHVDCKISYPQGGK